MATIDKPEMLLWLSDARGVFIPRDFAKCWNDRAKHVSGVSDESWTILESGPDAESYWDVWADVLDNARVTDENGVVFHLWQDGDLWLVPDGMEWSEESDTYVWPAEESSDED